MLTAARNGCRVVLRRLSDSFGKCREKVPGIGRTLVILGVVLVIIGFGLTYSDKIPYLGRLPGDILVKKERFSFYFPLTTSIIVSIILTILFSIFRK